MKKYVKAKRGAKISAFVLSFLFVVTSMTTTYAASYGAAGVHDELYQEAEGMQGEISETPELSIGATGLRSGFAYLMRE